jgi:hypothetical protein
MWTTASTRKSSSDPTELTPSRLRRFPSIRQESSGAELVDDQRFNNYRALDSDLRPESSASDHQLEQIEIGMGREWCNVAVVRTRMPRPVGEIERLPGKEGRI